MIEITPAILRRDAEVARNQAHGMAEYEAYVVRGLADLLDAAAAALVREQQTANRPSLLKALIAND